MKKPTESPKGKPKRHTPKDEWFTSTYPTILAYLCDLTWDDGTDRDASSLAISAEGSQFKLSLNDKEMRQSLYTAGDSLEEALALMEECLESGKGSWRSWNASGKKGGK